jgi:hypothetical protein
MRDGYHLALAHTPPANYLSSSLNISYACKLPRGLKIVARLHWLFQEPWRTATETALTVYPNIYWKPRAGTAPTGLQSNISKLAGVTAISACPSSTVWAGARQCRRVSFRAQKAHVA